MGLSRSTVTKTLTRVYRKMGIGGGGKEKRIKALCTAIEQGWISVDEVETGDDWRGDV